MERALESTPRVCFEVEKIIGISSDGNYQVQWAPAWVSKFHLVGCEHLVQQFLQQQQSEKTSQEVPEPAPTANLLQDSLPIADVDSSEPPGIEAASKMEEVQQLGHGRSDTGPNTEQTLLVVGEDEHMDSHVITVSATIKTEDNDDSQPVTSPLVYIMDNKSSSPWYTDNQSNETGKCIDSSALDTTKIKTFSLASFGTASEPSCTSFDTTSEPFTHREILYNRKHECQHCGKTFKQTSHLKSHLKTHSGERPYRCSYCNATFAHKHNMERHYRTHIGINPFMCNECGQAFSSKSDLKIHTCYRGPKT